MAKRGLAVFRFEHIRLPSVLQEQGHLAAMESVTILWSLGAAIAIVMATVCAGLWVIEPRDRASLMLCILGVATAASGYLELGMMHSATAAEYGEWFRWYYLPASLALVAMVLFVHYYLGTGNVWLLSSAVFMRSVIVAVNFSVHSNFGFSEIVSLRSVSLFGEKVSAIGVAIPSGRQWFAMASLIVLVAYLTDAARRRWLTGGRESRRKSLAVSLGIVVPYLSSVVYGQLLFFGVLQATISNLPWFLGALLVMAYELGRDTIRSRRAQRELTELRGQLAQAERASILGQLASTLAHELAQPLSASLANVEAARAHLQEELRAILDDIGKDDGRAIEIIGRMRQFLNRRSVEMKPLNVEDVVQDVVSLVRSDANSKHVALLLRMQPGLPRVSGDRLHLSQVLLNLVTNGIQAVQSRPPDARRIVVEAKSNGNGKVEMAVGDSGPGIPDDIADKVFDHFFTTKADGMGVGLALSRSIIEAHGGHLWIDHMAPRDGAVFRFTLPRV